MNSKSLTSVCNITTGKLDSNAAEKNGIYPYFTCAPEPLTINTYAFDDDVILLAGNNASGNFHCQRYKGKFNAYQRTYVLTVKSGYDIDYVFYNLKIELQNLRKLAQGSQTKFLTMQILDGFQIADIPLEEQRNISSVLSALDKKIENNDKIIFELESLAKTIYNYWFLQFEFPNKEGKPYKSSGGKMVWNEELKREIPEGWKVDTLKDHIRLTKGVSYTSNNIKTGEGIPMINLASIDVERNYKPEELKFYNGNYNKSKEVKYGDMLIACTDLTRNAYIVGSPILVPDTYDKFLYSMDLAKLELADTVFNPMYLYMTLRTDYYHNYIKGFASGTNVMHLNTDGIAWYKTYIPQRNIQDQFANIISLAHAESCKIMRENQQNSSLRDFLLPLLMNGQVGFKE